MGFVFGGAESLSVIVSTAEDRFPRVAPTGKLSVRQGFVPLNIGIISERDSESFAYLVCAKSKRAGRNDKITVLYSGPTDDVARRICVIAS